MLPEKDVKLLTMLLMAKETSLMNACVGYLNRTFGEYNVMAKQDFVYATGSIPILLVAHLDTVWDKPPAIYTDKEKNLWTSKVGGLGADDRAGVFAIMKLLQLGYRPSVLFTTGEESGGLGAMSFVKDFPEPPVPTKYIIEIDRRGRGQAVFYDCGNQDFVDYVETFGFVKHKGIFSDISFLCPQWDIAGVNLSAGYYKEHTEYETLRVEDLLATIDKVKNMLDIANEAPSFAFESIVEDMDNRTLYTRCSVCGQIVPIFSTTNIGGVPACLNCVSNFVQWCEVCGKPYFTASDSIKVCYECSNKEYADELQRLNSKTV